MGWLLRAGAELAPSRAWRILAILASLLPLKTGMDASAQLSHPAGAWVMTSTEPSREGECAEFKRFRRGGKSLKERAKFALEGCGMYYTDTTSEGEHHTIRVPLVRGQTRVYNSSKR